MSEEKLHRKGKGYEYPPEGQDFWEFALENSRREGLVRKVVLFGHRLEYAIVESRRYSPRTTYDLSLIGGLRLTQGIFVIDTVPDIKPKGLNISLRDDVALLLHFRSQKYPQEVRHKIAMRNELIAVSMDDGLFPIVAKYRVNEAIEAIKASAPEKPRLHYFRDTVPNIEDRLAMIGRPGNAPCDILRCALKTLRRDYSPEVRPSECQC